MASSGWVKLWRKLLDSDMYAELNSKQRDVMIQCLLLANHKEKEWEWNGEIQKCEPGQFKTSLDSLRKHCSNDVSIRNIRTTLLKLEKWGFLTNKSTKTGRIITVCNWLIHQNKDDITDKDIDKQLTKSRQTADKQLTTNKNVKNVKNDKKKESTPKIKYSEYVLMREVDYKTLVKKYGEGNTRKFIEKLDNYKGANGKKYKDDYRAILNWVVNEVLGNKQQNKWDAVEQKIKEEAKNG